MPAALSESTPIKYFGALLPKAKALWLVFWVKLFLKINGKGEILDFMLTHGHVNDRDPLKNKSFHDKIFGKLFGDKDYISQILF
jgi:hypothetical protein